MAALTIAPGLRGSKGVADFSRARFPYVDLRGANLHRTDLSGSDLRGANLWSVGLGGARLAGADLRVAFLIGTDLRDADLSGADEQPHTVLSPLRRGPFLMPHRPWRQPHSGAQRGHTST
ncbi:pentapeptide repeat-containing protein [Nonomuraea sp. 10N515B]|uniref:pentapeptide repeat-containing protein n=1 Tax=Nonomuraea sp. 10N515B TaxID=3457422 RepID=UPI003FCE599C